MLIRTVVIKLYTLYYRSFMFVHLAQDESLAVVISAKQAIAVSDGFPNAQQTHLKTINLYFGNLKPPFDVVSAAIVTPPVQS